MSQYFFDSSALVKRYVDESGTAWVVALTAPEAENVLIVAQIAQVEIVSSVMRRAREGSLSERMARQTRLLVELDMARQYRIVALTGDIVERAEDLLERHVLRASDAIQLASALEARERIIVDAPGGLSFVSSDVRLLAAAASEGLTTIDPNSRI